MFLPEMCYTLKCHKNRLYALEFEVNLEAGAKLGNFEGGGAATGSFKIFVFVAVGLVSWSRAHEKWWKVICTESRRGGPPPPKEDPHPKGGLTKASLLLGAS